jgi:hypothetical protein
MNDLAASCEVSCKPELTSRRKHGHPAESSTVYQIEHGVQIALTKVGREREHQR